MLDQHWLCFSSDISDPADDDRNVTVAAITNMGLKRFAPTPVEQ
jgi:hypothetical protein